MRYPLTGRTIGILTAVNLITAAVTAFVWVGGKTASGQASAYRAPRTAEGKPDLNGIWQALNTANWDLQDHAPRPSPVVPLGARGAIPAGAGVVDGGEIPYLPAAAEQKKQNFDNWLLRDPTIKCFLPGVPRATYMPFPFEIVQGASDILMAYEFADATRVIYMNSKEESPVETWMGWSRGHWDGETLVVDVTSFNDQTWFDTAGNFHSDALHVVERYTATDRDHLLYEATIEDPKVFSRPWKIRMPLYRRVEANARLLEFKCVEFAEEVMYGHLRKKATQ
jgi:hypothetical protein